MKNGDAARPGPGSPVPDAERTTFDWPRHSGTTESVLQELEVQLGIRRRRQRRVRVAVSSIVALLVAGWVWQVRVPSHPAAPAIASATAVVPERQVLPDGSVVLLRTGAQLSVDYSSASRRVLLKRGEALFDVARNTERPFIVQAGGLDVRAVGTAFAVSLQPSAVEVLVTEGEVAVQSTRDQESRTNDLAEHATEPQGRGQTTEDRDRRTDDSRPPLLVKAGNLIVVEIAANAPAPQMMPVSETEIKQRLGWRVPTLQFARTPLGDAVAMINQHSRIRLVLEGTTLGSLPLSGAIRADNIDALIDLLELDNGIQAERRGETEIVLRKSP